MSTSAQDPDTCPRCGTHVEANASYGIGARGEGEELPEPNQQGQTCPNCGAKLRRAVGSSWNVLPEPWRVVVRASPHDAVVREGGDLVGMLVRGSSVTPTEEGLGPGRYEFEVEATDYSNARERVEAAAAMQQVTIEEIEDVRPSPEG